MKKEKLLKYENGKLKKQLIFSIPAGKEVCGMECKHCYAIKFQRLYPSVLPYRKRMYDAANKSDFVDTIIEEIKACKKPLVACRIHESGEYYSQEYVDKWTAIALALPNINFYSFTKRLNDFDFTKFKALPNVAVINSLHTGKLNYDKLTNLGSSIPICPATTSHAVCGVDCTYCMYKGQADVTGINFVKH